MNTMKKEASTSRTSPNDNYSETAEDFIQISQILVSQVARGTLGAFIFFTAISNTTIPSWTRMCGEVASRLISNIDVMLREYVKLRKVMQIFLKDAVSCTIFQIVISTIQKNHQ